MLADASGRLAVRATRAAGGRSGLPEDRGGGTGFEDDATAGFVSKAGATAGGVYSGSATSRALTVAIGSEDPSSERTDTP